MAKFYECGICGCVHEWDWDGSDCSGDAKRLTSWEVEALPNDAEIMTWEERLKADLWGDHVTE